MGRVFFTSDQHWDHRRVAEIRGFESVEEQIETLKDGWRSVQPRDDDQFWILGDIAASSPTVALMHLAQLPGEKHLILGNHDAAHPMHRHSYRAQRQYLSVFTSVQPFARRRIDGRNVLLSHFPYHLDRGEPRFTQWRLRDEGELLLHGHTHEPYKTRDDMPRHVHVGVDAWDFAPVEMQTVSAMIESKASEWGIASTSTLRLDRSDSGPGGSGFASDVAS